MEDTLLEKALLDAYKQAPSYIQKYIQGGDFQSFMKTLTSHFGLHADIAGKVENEILMTIIGLTPPADLPENLKNQAGVAPGLIAPILEELNTEVFVPLRESLRNEGSVEDKEVVSAPAPVQEKWIQMTPTQPQPSIVVNQIPQQITPPAPVVPPSSPIQEVPVVVPAPVATVPEISAPVSPQIPVQQSAPQPLPPQPIPAPISASTPTPAPEYHEMMSMMRTMSKDIESLKGGTQPAMTPWKPVSVPVPPKTPSYISPTIKTEAPVSIPVSAPTSVSTEVVPQTHSTPEHIIIPQRTTGGDPYREPVE